MNLNQAKGCLVGLAVGDALGATNEFQKFPTYVDDLVGGGPFDLKPGEWTDDTSMALAMGDSLRFMGRFNYREQLDRYVMWLVNGSYNAAGRCIGSGSHTRKSLARYLQTGETISQDTSEKHAGNGSLMRLAPIPIFYHDSLDEYGGNEDIIFWAGESSKTTHAAPQAVDACRYFSFLLYRASSLSKSELVATNFDIDLHPEIDAAASLDYSGLPVDQFANPSGYVVHTLRSALWCFYNADNFRDGAVLAANLGGDSDTVAAIYGQLAGMHYGYDNIPSEWIQKLAWKEWIVQLAEDLYKHEGKI